MECKNVIGVVALAEVVILLLDFFICMHVYVHACMYICIFSMSFYRNKQGKALRYPLKTCL